MVYFDPNPVTEELYVKALDKLYKKTRIIDFNLMTGRDIKCSMYILDITKVKTAENGKT